MQQLVYRQCAVKACMQNATIDYFLLTTHTFTVVLLLTTSIYRGFSHTHDYSSTSKDISRDTPQGLSACKIH